MAVGWLRKETSQKHGREPNSNPPPGGRVAKNS